MQPEAVLQPRFQMSFAATTALVALAEALERAGARDQHALAHRLAAAGDSVCSAC
jgi:predicted membrane metal-binding protein